ncbi:MAG: flagellar protein FlgN [Clostridiales bacterium]|nr:flagellar protein FlgN [Clostridiales bacterium]
MGGAFPAYLNLLRELSGHLDRLAVLAQEKADAARQDDLLALDEVLKQEQAMTLALRGLEQRRQKLLAELGLADSKLSDLPGKCPPELQDEARNTTETLRQSYQVYRSCADMARNTLELTLHQIDKFVAAAGVDPAEAGAGYEAPGAEPPKNMKTDFRA